MKNKVLIAGTGTDNYCRAVKYLNVPYLVSLDLNDLNKGDFLLIPGGVDVNPERYHQENTLSIFDNKLDDLQFPLIDKALSLNVPVLGICRGHQLLNVYFGGTLIQDIPSLGNKLEHRKVEGQDSIHDINIKEGSFLYEIYGSKAIVNSSHHQGIDIPGKDLIICATSNDGIKEAFYHKNLEVYGVQFHPERMNTDKTVQGIEIFKLLFGKSAQNHRNSE